MNVGRVRALSCLGIVLVATGCKVGPDFTRPQTTVNANWQGVRDPRLASQTAADSRWWQTFSDPALDRLIERAYRQNLPLQIAGLRIVEARAQLGVATGQQFPQLQVAFGQRHRGRASARTPPARRPSRHRHYGDFRLGFDAAWELDFWGKYRRGVEAESRRPAGVGRRLLHRPRLAERGGRPHLRRDPDLRGADRAGPGERPGSGGGAATSPSPASATAPPRSWTSPRPPPCWRAPGRPSPSCRSALQQARNALSTLLGQPPGTVDSAAGRAARSSPGRRRRWRSACRPRCCGGARTSASAELLAAAQCARIGVAKAELYPSFTLFGTIGLNSAVTEAGWPEPVLAAAASSIRSGPRIIWPFFNYGRLTNAVRVEDARFQQLLVELPRHRAQGGAGGGGRAGRLSQAPRRRWCSTQNAVRGRPAIGGAGAGAVPGRRGRLPARAGRAARRSWSSRTDWPRRARRSPPT